MGRKAVRDALKAYHQVGVAEGIEPDIDYYLEFCEAHGHFHQVWFLVEPREQRITEVDIDE